MPPDFFVFFPGKEVKRGPRTVPRRAEGERPVFREVQRWEAVFRRERRPASLDRFFRVRGLPCTSFCGKVSLFVLSRPVCKGVFYHETSKRP
ncbi:hypothetical protein SUBVAR_04164 [Subdoligranulum variabile DSM 15176]|uniref:Uncharacterized protein n=1 Tax=Subdoligranulum variabile DSM 15176 TaxID=411471 RepID=D1PIJ9_9FIRM|nr:hypothetical protein SUBVAR_04164 [Subdoligranulum variabile DSM 15176]